MTTSSPVRIVGCDQPGPSDPVRIVNWQDVAQLDTFENTAAQFSLLSNNIVENLFSLSYGWDDVGGVRRMRLHWDANRVIIADETYDLAAGQITINTADVVNPTTYYVYIRIVGGAAVVVVSTLDPELDPAVNYEYAWLSIVRMKSVATVLIVYYVRRAYCALELLLHHIGEYDLARVPQWLDGGGITINATTGAVDMAELEYRRLRFEGDIDAITGGALLIEDETIAYANLELIVKYSDGSNITVGKYHKMLLGVITSIGPSYPFVIVRQGLPAVEYATLDDAIIDAERVAANAFPTAYRGMVFPLAYVVMKVGDASDLTTIDLRSTGITGGGGGGGSAIGDHSLLVNLGADDHAQYLRADGTRDLTGNMAVDPGVTVDGVDISNHVTLPNIHHAQSHVIATTVGLGADHSTSGLTAGQVLRASGAAAAAFASLQAADIPALAYLPTAGGNLTGNVTADALVTIDGVDVSVHAATANAHHNAVTLNAAADTLLGLSTQQITLDTQAANTVLAGPATGAAATPTFRAIDPADFPTTGELGVVLANGVNNNINIGTALLIRITGPTASFSVDGFTGGYAGRVLHVYNAAAQNMTANNEAGTSTAANRILTLGGSSATNGIGLMIFIYSAIDSRWILEGIRA